MTRQRSTRRNERGFALVFTAVALTTLLLFTGLAVDSGRAYLVKAQLSKAVDGAALGAARMLNSGDPRQEAGRIFRANFPADYLGVTSVTDPSDPDFFSMVTETETGSNIVTVTASATVPTTFMRLANFHQVTVQSMGEARRRMVDLTLVLDVSLSIGQAWPLVRDAARSFVSAFDEDHDRIALVTYGNGASVRSEMPVSRGFNKAYLMGQVPQNLPSNGRTNMVEGLYRAWDEVRFVPSGQQSGLRVIVLFTDGATNGVPGVYAGSPQVRSLHTREFPKANPDPDNATSNTPAMDGLFPVHQDTGLAASPSANMTANQTNWQTDTRTLAIAPLLPAMSAHRQPARSIGIPLGFPLVDSSLTVNGQPQHVARPLFTNGAGQRPAHVVNVNNASRNLVEIIAHRARTDADGDYPIRIYTLGMGSLVRLNLGYASETSESILQRIANDVNSPDHDPDQPIGKYYYAQTAADVGPAFQQLQSEIVRLTK